MIRTLQSLSKSQGPLRSLSQSLSSANGWLYRDVARSTYSTTTRVAEIFQNRVNVSSKNLSITNGIRNFSTSEDLAAKKCIPCEAKHLKPMTEEAANELMPKVPEWSLVSEDGVLKLQKIWKTKNFLKGLEFFQLVAGVAEAEGHHPDLHLLDWNSVKIDVWTHAQGGLTENDFIVAAKISTLDVKHLLSKKALKH